MKIKNVLEVISAPNRFRKVLSLGIAGYLIDQGWVRTIDDKMPVDIEGSPIPWVTYPFIDFIAPRLNKQMKIFEYGSGNSTLFYSKKVSSVVSIEHDERWYQPDRYPSNCKVHLFKLDEDYTKAFYLTKSGDSDVIIIDGADRVDCIKHCVSHAKNEAILVLDDSERDRYKSGVEILLKEGYKKIDFFGMAPGVTYKKCTSIFYRSLNVINL